MQHSQKREIAFERLISRMPPEVITSFSDVQLSALRAALASRSWRRHPVDLRFSIPFIFTKGIYIVFLMGTERRSRERLAKERSLNPIWTPINIAVILALMGIGIGAIFGAFQLRYLNFSTLNSQDVHPVTVPFKEGKADCEKSGREWQDGKCIDYEHNPSF